MANIGNLGSSFVATAPSTPTAGTSLIVTAATGANFPAAPFYATLTPPGSLSTFGTSEIVLVTGKSTDTFTITRAQKSTTAKTVAVGWIITNGIYVEDLMSTITFGEVPSGLVNTSNTVYTTVQPFTSIEVFKNGVRMKGGGADYTVTNNTTITFVSAPATGAVLLVNYIMGNQIYLVGSNSLMTDETPAGTVNGSNATFTTSQPYIGGSLQVFINGVKQKRVTHFVETTPSSGTFTMGDAPLTGDDIMVSYQFVLSTTANADTVDGYHANATPTANQIPVLDANARLPSAITIDGADAFHSTTQSIANGTVQAVVFNSENYDTNNYHSTSSNTSRMTVPSDGKYQVTATVPFVNNATGVRYVFFCINGATSGRYGSQTVPGTGAGLDTIITGTTTIPLVAGDYVEVYVYQNSGGALNLHSNTTFPGAIKFTITRLGA